MKTDATRSPETADLPRLPKETGARAGSAPFSQVLGEAQPCLEPGVAATGAATPPLAGDGSPLVSGQASFQALLLAQTAALSGATLPRDPAARRTGSEPGSHGSRGDPLDPATRQSAQLGPPLLSSGGPSAAAPSDAPVQASARASLEDVLPALVRRIAWSGDGRKGSLRLEFSAGALAGGTLVVHSDEGRVRVELQAPAGADVDAWKERIVRRLEDRQLQVEDVDVR